MTLNDDSVTDSGRAAVVKTFRWRIRKQPVGHVLETETDGEWVEQARGSRQGCSDVLSHITQGKRKLFSEET
jgi:hypothetical protein